MEQQVNFNIAQNSPNLAQAAQSAGISGSQLGQVEQISFTIKKHKQLTSIGVDKARSTFNALGKDQQDALRALYPDSDYMKGPDNAIWGAIKKVGASKLNPIVDLFEVAGLYNKAINLPYKMYRSTREGKDPFAYKTWRNAWDGIDQFDKEAFAEAENVFGKERMYVAKHLIEGMKPGEIISSYGGKTEDILKAVEEAFNEPEKFKNVIDAAKYAQISVGRDIARMLDDKPTKIAPGVDYISSRTKNVSGVLDFITQIVIDPLTWLTGGSSKALTKGTQLKNVILELGADAGVKKVFRENKGVRDLWDKDMGPLLKEFHEGDAAKRALVRNEIARKVPGYNNDEAIRTLSDAKVFDAGSAEKYFRQAENVGLLIGGRVDGIDYARNGVALARKHRQIKLGLQQALDKHFYGIGGRTAEELGTKGEDIVSKFATAGSEADKLINPAMVKLAQEQADINAARKVGRAISRNPSGEILVGKNAAKTAATFRLMAQQLLPKDMANYLTEKFLGAEVSDQVVILRNLDAAIMYRYGLKGHPDGEKFIDETLRQKYGNTVGFSSMTNQAVPLHVADDLHPATRSQFQSTNAIDSMGPIHINQLADAFTVLPLEQINALGWGIRQNKNLIYAIGGATQSKLSRDLVDAWSVLTLFPRLGIRSAIDEGFFYALTAGGRDLFKYASLRGKKISKLYTSYTGSAEAVGPIRKVYEKLTGKTVSGSISQEERWKMAEAIAKKSGASVEEADFAVLREMTAQRAIELYGRKLDDQELEYFLQSVLMHPDINSTMARSVTARTGLGGMLNADVLDGIISTSMLTKALDELNVKAGGTFRTFSTRELSDINNSYLTLAHFDNWFRRFVPNRKVLTTDKNGKAIRTYDPVYVFFRNNGLRDREDFVKARNEIMDSIGVRWMPDDQVYKIVDQAGVDAFIKPYSKTTEYAQRGLTEEETVRALVERVLVDLHNTFHGGENKFNQALLDEITKRHTELSNITRDTGKVISQKWRKAAASIDFNTFEKLTKDHQPVGEISTALEFEGLTDGLSWMRKFGNKAMEMMDAQVNGIYRQPAVMVTYTQLRKSYAKLEKEFADSIVKNTLKSEAGTRYSGKQGLEELREIANTMAQKRFTEIATQEAADTILKYADNPSIRSNFAVSVRTVGRFYRATEDFWRRIYRLKDVAPSVLYRLRLANVGISASGFVHQDQQGNQYVMMPMDDILFKMVDSTYRTLTGKDASPFKQPSFNDFTFKLNMVNPSFTPDAGMPALSGPIAGLSVIGIKNLLGMTKNPTAEKIGEGLDTLALGNLGDNITVSRAIMPSFITRLWDTLPVNEKSRQETTAAMQAMAYMAAYDKGIDPNATEAEKFEYLKNLRISAHNVIAVRSLLGLISPVTPTMQESKGIPDYLLNVGVTGLRPEFSDILMAVMKRGDATDPYEQALATFIGKHPNKLIYTVARNQRETKAVIQKTNQVKNWAIENRSLIDKYGEAAWMFAPQVGDFNMGVYNWFQAEGLMSDKSLEDYYTDVAVAEDKYRYYEIARQERDYLSSETSITARDAYIQRATMEREALKASNPLLNLALTSGGNEIATEERMLSTMSQMVDDPNVPMKDIARTKMKTAINLVREFVAFSNDTAPYSMNPTQIKRDRKEALMASLEDLSAGDPAIREAMRAVFRSLINYYSRDTYVAFQKGF